MWDNWNVTSDTHKQTIDHPELYDFVDISQNSQTTGQDNWDNAQYVLQRVKKDPRPVNSTKIYGSHTSKRSEEHTSELQSLMRISYAVYCLKKKKTKKKNNINTR